MISPRIVPIPVPAAIQLVDGRNGSRATRLSVLQMVDDVGARNVLGHFWGWDRTKEGGADAAIVLYLGNLREYGDRLRTTFEDQVKITYLHELGHYLGLDEEDLEKRGLG